MLTVQEPQLRLKARSARELMVPIPMTVHEHWPVAYAAEFLLENRITAAPVIDAQGRPVGVVSQTDIVRFVSDGHCDCQPSPEYYEKATIKLLGKPAIYAMDFRQPSQTTVAGIMTPIVYAISAETPSFRVIDAMLSRNIHRLFVVDASGALIGVIGALDVLANLCD